MRKVIFLLMVMMGASIGAQLPFARASNGQVTDLCKQAVINKGLQGYQLQHLNVVSSRGGGYRVTGQATNGAKRLEFTCSIDSQMKLEEVSLTELTGSPPEKNGSKAK